MAVPDPAPSALRSSRQRLVRMMRAAAALSIIIAALAVAMVARGKSETPIHIAIATSLGIGLAVLMGSALMTWIFLGKSSGHDANARMPATERDEQ